MAPSTGVQALPTIEETNLVHPALEMHYEALPGPPTDLRNLATLDTAALASGGDRNIESNFYQYLSLMFPVLILLPVLLPLQQLELMLQLQVQCSY